MKISTMTCLLWIVCCGAFAGGPSQYFRIQVMDEDTSRGIPLVQVTAISGIDYYTDSAGVVAFWEPSLMGQKVWFEFKSHGYATRPDGFGMHGRTLDVQSGTSATVTMRREQIAQRLYRITGAGIYHDTLLLGEKAPISRPLLNAGVLGQDSTLCTVYKGKLFWIWGDTSAARHPLAANFQATCARSLLPGDGGLDPEVGVNLDYFQQGEFVKPMTAMPDRKGVYWLAGVVSSRDSSGTEKLLANYAHIKPPMDTIGRGLVEFDDEAEVFRPIRKDSLGEIIELEGHATAAEVDGKRWFYYNPGSKLTRVPDSAEAIRDKTTYEAFTCLKEGNRFTTATAEILDRGSDGKLKWSWKKNTAAIGWKEEEQLQEARFIKAEERRYIFKDAQSGKPFRPHSGSLAYNPWRKKWVLIVSELMGTSVLGEVWYAEADAAEGPWSDAVKVVTHNKYTLYNPLQHPEFSKENGRVIFFEGTYTQMFSGADLPTPRYDYNQVMFKLELNDPRLAPAQRKE